MEKTDPENLPGVLVAILCKACDAPSLVLNVINYVGYNHAF